MRSADCYRLAKVLLPQMPGFVSNKKSEIFITPIGNVIRGFLFESSAYSREDFYFWWFFMPICRPITYLALGNGRRLDVPGGHAGWRSDMEDLPEKLLAAMQPFALPLLRSLNTNQDTIEALYRLRSQREPGGKTTRHVTDIYVQNDIACLHILDGQFVEAKVMLDMVIDNEHGTDRRQWVLDFVERTKGLRRKLLEDPQLAVAQVKESQDFTFKALKLEPWR